jgi:hypothetical protein
VRLAFWKWLVLGVRISNIVLWAGESAVCARKRMRVLMRQGCRMLDILYKRNTVSCISVLGIVGAALQTDCMSSD